MEGIRRDHPLGSAGATRHHGEKICRVIALRVIVTKTIERNEDYVGLRLLLLDGVGAVIDNNGARRVSLGAARPREEKDRAVANNRMQRTECYRLGGKFIVVLRSPRSLHQLRASHDESPWPPPSRWPLLRSAMGAPRSFREGFARRHLEEFTGSSRRKSVTGKPEISDRGVELRDREPSR